MLNYELFCSQCSKYVCACDNYIYCDFYKSHDLKKGKFIVYNKIRSMRNDLGWTQEKLAYEAGLTQTTISSLETYKYAPTLFDAYKISQALGVGIDSVFIFTMI